MEHLSDSHYSGSSPSWYRTNNNACHRRFQWPAVRSTRALSRPRLLLLKEPLIKLLKGQSMSMGLFITDVHLRFQNLHQKYMIFFLCKYDIAHQKDACFCYVFLIFPLSRNHCWGDVCRARAQDSSWRFSAFSKCSSHVDKRCGWTKRAQTTKPVPFLQGPERRRWEASR